MHDCRPIRFGIGAEPTFQEHIKLPSLLKRLIQQQGDVSDQEKEELMEANAVSRRIVNELFDDFLLNNCNPFVTNKTNVIMNIQEKKTENEIKQVKEKCNELGVPFDVTEDFNMSDVWWLQPEPKDPYKNISYNKVPPTETLCKTNKGRNSVMLVGTSITAQSLNLDKLQKNTKKKVKVVKCYTITKEKAMFMPDLNIEDVAIEIIKEEEFDWIIVEVGVNEISNMDTRKSNEENVKEVTELVIKLMDQARKMINVQPGVKVVLLKQIERFDSKEKKIWRDKMNRELYKK